MTYSRRIYRFFRGALSVCFHFLWPSSCVFCGALGELCCEECLQRFVSEKGSLREFPGFFPRRICCGAPYEGAARKLVHRLKYGGESSLGPLLGKALGRRYRSLLEGAVFVPVPLHEESSRGYNQSLLLARGLARAAGGRVWDCLRWHSGRAEGPQTRKSRMLRLALSPEALFFASPSPASLFSGPVVLVDDVCTTGTTLRVAAGVLARRGYSVETAVVWGFVEKYVSDTCTF